MATEGTDDLIVHLMSMGFDLTDCQDAVSFGKVSVETAVEWLVAGKPGFKLRSDAEQTGPSLKLRQQTSTFNSKSSAFSKPIPIGERTSSPSKEATNTDTASAALTHVTQNADLDVDPSDSNVVSRLHLSDNQRKQKEGFEQKKREEAKRKAMMEKKRQKEDKDRVLKEIAADREKKRQLQGVKDKVEDLPSPSKDQKVETASAPGPSQTQGAKCLLQIRFPDGRSLRQSFDSTTCLHEVWSFVQGKTSDLTGYTFIQPFPQHEFTEDEMQASLQDLKLTPSGSLVLQKKNKPQQTSATRMDVDEEDVIQLPPRTGRIGGPTVVPPDSPNREQPDNDYASGQGQGLNEEGSLEPNEIEELNVEPQIENQQPVGMELGNQPGGALGNRNQEGEGQGNGNQFARGYDIRNQLGEGGLEIGDHPAGGLDIDGGLGLPAAFAGGRGRMGRGGRRHFPPPGNIMGQPNDIFGMQVAHGQQQMFGGVGQRLVSEAENQYGAPEEQQDLRMARERALQRVEARQQQLREQQQPMENEAGALSRPKPFSSVQKLVTLCLKYVAHRLNDPRNQLLSLGGISEDKAQIVLNYLIKEKQLKPKTLNPFIPCYLRQLVLDTYPYATNELLHSVRLHKYLTHLSLSACSLITDAGFMCLSVLKKLRHLNISGCRQLTNGCSTVLCNFTSLVILNLEETGFSDQGVLEYIASNPEHLTHLNLNRTAVTQEVISLLQSKARQLKHLSLENTQVESLLGIDQLPSLESLNVARTGILPEALLCLRNCPCLNSLNIADTQKIKGDDALQNLQGLRLHTLGLPSRHTTTDKGIRNLIGFPLHSLDLTNYVYVTDEGFEIIGQIKSLRKLLLGNSKLTDEGMVFLGGLSNLEVLDLDRTLITDTGAAIVKEFTKLTELSMASTNLIKLNLSRTTVTSKGISALRLPCLEMLNIDGTKVRPDLTAAMVRGCPKLSQILMRNLEPFTNDDMLAESEMEVDS